MKKSMGEHRELYFSHIERIESLAQRLVERRFETAADLWNLEKGIIKHQVEIQNQMAVLNAEVDGITERKTCVSAKRTNWQRTAAILHEKQVVVEQKLDVLRRLNYKSRRFGDAFAWTFFSFSERDISPLMDNMPTSRIPTGISFNGMMAYAEAVGFAGLGFPVLHDMTTILRNGDVSFILPGQRPLTVELKTRVTEGFARAEVTSYAVLNAEQKERFETVTKRLRERAGNERAASPRQEPRRKNDRCRRQLDRLAKVRRVQDASTNTIMEDGKGKHMVVELPPGIVTHHWDIAASVVRRAKEGGGYASQAVDRSMQYIALHDPEYFSYPWDAEARAAQLPSTLPQDLVNSGIFFNDDPSRNGIWMLGVNEVLNTPATSYSRPILAQPLPSDVALDLAFDRVGFFVIINPGRVAAALENAGLEPQIEYTEQSINQDFVRVRGRLHIENADFTFEIRNLAYHARQFASEFLSVAGFVEIAKAMAMNSDRPARDEYLRRRNAEC